MIVQKIKAMNKRRLIVLLLWTQVSPAELPVVKLRPQIREIPLERVQPSLPFEELKKYLLDVYVTSKEAVTHAPYVVAMDDRRMIGGQHDRIYVRPGVPKGIEFALYRLAKKLTDPTTGEILGYRLLKVADVHYLRGGDPTTFEITSARMAIHPGDLLLPKIELTSADLKPRTPEFEIEGQIIEVLTPSIAHFGRYDLVLVNRGRRDGLKRGHLLKIWNQNFKVRDPVAGGWVQLPDQEVGKLLVVEPFDRVSYCLVFESKRPLRPFDRFTSR